MARALSRHLPNSFGAARTRRISYTLGVLMFLSGCTRITDVTPDRGLPGTIVTITGYGFAANPSSNDVQIGGTPARVISGDTRTLRVVALRNVKTGPVVVKVGTRTATSQKTFTREGSTLQATPLQDSDPELIEGRGTGAPDERFDMHPAGTNQPVLVVLAKPSDVDPEAQVSSEGSARDHVIAQLDKTNEYFADATYNTSSAAFTVMTEWLPLSLPRDSYMWEQEDIDRATAKVDGAKANLQGLQTDPQATQSDIDKAQTAVDDAEQKAAQAKNEMGGVQEPDLLFAEALSAAQSARADFDSFSDYLIVIAGDDGSWGDPHWVRAANWYLRTEFHAETTNPPAQFAVQLSGDKGIVHLGQSSVSGTIAHELSHFFGLGDLYSESFADGSLIRGNAEKFTLMGISDDKPLYIGYEMRYLPYYGPPGGPNVAILEWRKSPDFDETFDVVAHGTSLDPTTDGTVNLIQLRVVPGLDYYVEVRKHGDPATTAFDTQIPIGPSNPPWKGGVLVSRAVGNNDQSNNRERPVSLMPPERLMQVGQDFSDPLRTIRFSVEEKLSDSPLKFRVRVQWGHLPVADPNGNFDLRIDPWNPPPWESPDIWLNSLKNDDTTTGKIIYKNHDPGDETVPAGNGDPPWVNHKNVVFARIHNDGMAATPEPVRVTFYTFSPVTVGDNANWALLDTVDVGILAAGETKIVKTAQPWIPRNDQHSCVKVQIQKMNQEITFDNNDAQENFDEFETGAASPYEPVEFDAIARNPYTAPIVMDMRARNVPAEWFVALDHGSVWLPPRGEKKVHVVVWTDRTPEWISEGHSRSPRKAAINIEGWSLHRGDQVFPLGGVTTLGQAVRKVDLSITVVSEPTVGATFLVTGQVRPPCGGSHIGVQVIDPDGALHTEPTTSGAGGDFRYRTKYRADKPGRYEIGASVLSGSICSEADSTAVRVMIRPSP